MGGNQTGWESVIVYSDCEKFHFQGGVMKYSGEKVIAVIQNVAETIGQLFFPMPRPQPVVVRVERDSDVQWRRGDES